MTTPSPVLPLKFADSNEDSLPLGATPACSDWDVWAGPEVEGEDQLGVPTLFIRRINPKLTVRQFVQRVAKMGYPFKRVWLCKEFVSLHMNSVKKAESVFLHITSGLSGPMIAVEVDSGSAYSTVNVARRHQEFMFRVCVFVKIPWVAEPLAQDHVCLGPAFNDMCFRVGAGKPMRPSQYDADISLNALGADEVSDADLKAAAKMLIRGLRPN